VWCGFCPLSLIIFASSNALHPNDAALAKITALMHQNQDGMEVNAALVACLLFLQVHPFLYNFITDFGFCNLLFKMSCFLFSCLPKKQAVS